MKTTPRARQDEAGWEAGRRVKSIAIRRNPLCATPFSGCARSPLRVEMRCADQPLPEASHQESVHFSDIERASSSAASLHAILLQLRDTCAALCLSPCAIYIRPFFFGFVFVVVNFTRTRTNLNTKINYPRGHCRRSLLLLCSPCSRCTIDARARCECAPPASLARAIHIVCVAAGTPLAGFILGHWQLRSSFTLDATRGSLIIRAAHPVK